MREQALRAATAVRSGSWLRLTYSCQTPYMHGRENRTTRLPHQEGRYRLREQDSTGHFGKSIEGEIEDRQRRGRWTKLLCCSFDQLFGGRALFDATLSV